MNISPSPSCLSSFATGQGLTERFYCLTAEPGACFEEELASVLERYHALTPEPKSAFMLRFHLSDIATQAASFERMTAFYDGFVTVVGQPPANGARVALEVWEVGGTAEQRITVEAGHDARHLHLAHYSMMLSRSRSLQAEGSYRQTLEEFGNLVALVAKQGGTLAKNVHRTWIYCRDIDNNYAGLVKARTEIFDCQGLSHETHYIASTGIEGQSDPPGRLVAVDALSVFGLRPGQVEYMSALDHLSPTHAYGVTFERGTRIIYGDRSTYYLSGTASIDSRGEICHPGDVRMQTERTLENLSALMRNHGGALEDMKQAVVYLRDPADAGIVADVIAASDMRDAPCLMVKAPVCRPGWLVEIEGIAVNGQGNAAFPDFC